MPNKAPGFLNNKDINQSEIDSSLKLLNESMINNGPMLAERVEQTAKPNKTARNIHGENTENSTTTSSKSIPKSSTSNFIYKRSRESLESPITQVICRTAMKKYFDIQLIKKFFTTQQVDDCASSIEGDLPSSVRDQNQCENRADRTITKIKRSYTFISLVGNSNCQLVLDEDLSPGSVNILKESVKEYFLNVTQSFVNNQFKMPENQTMSAEDFTNKIKEYQNYIDENMKKRIVEFLKKPAKIDFRREYEDYFDKQKLALIAKQEAEYANMMKSKQEIIAELREKIENHKKELNKQTAPKNETLERVAQIEIYIRDLKRNKPNECDTTLQTKEITHFKEEIEKSENFINELKAQRSALVESQAKNDENEHLKEILEIDELTLLHELNKKLNNLLELYSQLRELLQRQKAELHDELNILKCKHSEKTN